MGENGITITKEMMQEFIKIQKSGVCNMISSEVRDMTGMTQAEHYYLLSHYNELKKEYDL